MSAMERENAKTVEYLEAKLKNSNMQKNYLHIYYTSDMYKVLCKHYRI